MKTTLLSFLVWYAIALLLGYLFFGPSFFATRDLIIIGIVVSLQTIFTPENNRKIWKKLFGSKQSSQG